MQAATEQAARALALYANEAEELRERLAQAQMESKGSDMSASFFRSARRLLSRQDSSSASRKEVSYYLPLDLTTCIYKSAATSQPRVFRGLLQPMKVNERSAEAGMTKAGVTVRWGCHDSYSTAMIQT